MRLIGSVVIIVAGSIALSGSAMAADMTGAAIKELISGKTVYVELTEAPPAELGRGVIYYAPSSAELYTTAMGSK